MVHVSLIVPDNVPRKFLNLAFDEGLIDIVYPSEPFALFDRSQSCACNTRNNLAIRGRTVIVKKNHHQALAFPFYSLPADCTFEETFVIVTWLLRNKLKTFSVKMMDKVFCRVLKANCWFHLSEYSCCDCFTLIDDPIFLTSKIVLSPFGKGPVLECCIQKESS